MIRDWLPTLSATAPHPIHSKVSYNGSRNPDRSSTGDGPNGLQ
jgi:hypothetical protein